MSAQVDNYKCPACTGPIHFVGNSGKVECEYCGTTYEIAEIEALYSKKEPDAQVVPAAEEASLGSTGQEDEWDMSGLSDDWGTDGEGMKAYSCPSCGAELICDETTAATSCPYCGNPTIVPGQFSGTLKPDYVIPFKLDKEAAIAALKNHYKGKLFLPDSFKQSNRLKEIKGVYVPFWLFDGKADADVDFLATRVSAHREGDYEVTVTSHYAVRRSGTVGFEKIPVDGSTKMPDEYMDAIEPFDYSELKPFSAAYLPGFLADKYDVPAEDCVGHADERARNSAYEAMAASVTGYSTCTPVKKNIQLRRGQVKYALMPVWLLNTKWNGQDFLFAMNGQTGRLVGRLPVSKAKYWAWFGGIAVGASLVFSLLLNLFF